MQLLGYLYISWMNMAIEVGFLRRNVLNIGCLGSYISGCQCMHGCEAGELMQLCQDSESNSTVASLLLHASLRYGPDDLMLLLFGFRGA